MHALSKMTLIGIVASLMLLTGCKETYNMTFTNVSGQVIDLAVDSPEGSDDLGSLDNGRSRKYTLKLDGDDLPARCHVQAGGLVKDFTLDKHMKRDLFFYVEERTIVGPLDKNTRVDRTVNEKHKSIKTGNQGVVTGDKVPGEAPKSDGGNTGGGGERIIDQSPVID